MIPYCTHCTVKVVSESIYCFRKVVRCASDGRRPFTEDEIQPSSVGSDRSQDLKILFGSQQTIDLEGKICDRVKRSTVSLRNLARMDWHLKNLNGVLAPGRLSTATARVPLKE